MTDNREARRVRAQILAADDAGQRPTVGGRRVSRAWPGEVWLCWADTRGLVRLGEIVAPPQGGPSREVGLLSVYNPPKVHPFSRRRR